ncbi:Ulk/fused protein kinase, partial [Globisporangium splendens]
MLDSFETEGEFCMVTEYAQGELFQILEDDRQLPEDEIRKIAIQLAQALHVLHSNRIIHRDMKPQNILIGSKQQIKLCDFGFARAISHGSSLLTSIKGTPLYMAPELVRQQPYNYTVDLWSLGVILYELAVGRPPFYTDRIVPLIEMIVREPVRYPPTMSPEFQSFLAGLLNKDPSRRMAWPEILSHPFIQETPEQYQTRLQLESQVRSLPRFFEESGRQFNAEVKPSIERLCTSGEWKICDPETGRQINGSAESNSTATEPLASQAAKLPEGRMPHETSRDCIVEKSTESAVAVVKTPSATARFWEEWRQVEHAIENSTNDGSILDNESFRHALQTLRSIRMRGTSTEFYGAVASIMHTQYRALMAFLKSVDSATSIASIITIRSHVHAFLESLVAECQSGEVDGPLSDIVYQVVRCCMMFTTIINAVDSDSQLTKSIDYRDFCKGDIKAVSALLKLKSARMFNAHSKTLKWLGSMLDRSTNLTMFLEQVHPSGVIETLCEVLHTSEASRSPGGRISKGGRDLGHFAAFALSTFVQPDGKNWGPLHPFPIVMLMSRASESVHQADVKDVKHLFKLRVKIHSEVVTQLLKNGLSELISLLFGELSDRANKKSNHDEEGEGDDDEDDDQSSICCILKILVHACRSSVSFSKKLPHAQTSSRLSTNKDVISILLSGVTSKAFRVVELYFAVELLAVILHRSVLSKGQVWICSKALYPLFCESQDVALLSALSSFYSDAIESGAIDETIVNEGRQDEYDEELWNFLARGFLPERCSDAVFRLFEHQQFFRLSESERSAKLQMLSCYNIRAQGLVDPGVVLLLRVASKSGKQAASNAKALGGNSSETKSLEIESIVEAFEQDSAWKILSNLLVTGGDDLLSPWGLFCFLKLMRIVREMQCSDVRMETAINESLIPHLVNLLELKHITYLFHWPDTVGGGSNAVKALVHAIVKVLGIPFMHIVSEELLVGTQEILYDVDCVQKLLGVLRFVFSTKEFHLEASVLELPMSFLSRLITSSEHFGAQFVRADGMAIIEECGMLRSDCSPSLIIDTILIVSQLARSSQEHYDCILRANLVPDFRNLVQHPEPMVRAKSLNCIGNLCRHSTLFYEQFVAPIPGSTSLLDGVIRRLADSDSYVRRLACFAIGNAAFHNDSLYSALQPAIPLLIQNLRDSEEKTRSNAGGALGNLVRNSDELCAELCNHQAPLELFELAMTDSSIASRRIVLFSLGNFCVYPQCFEAILQAEPAFVNQLERLHDEIESDEVSKKNIRRILSKIDGLGVDRSTGGYAS